jgi:two-component system phosphate regulon sensor histidine kinase PhoR
VITSFVIGLVVGLGIGFIYRWQQVDRFRRFEGRRFAAPLPWRKLWTLEVQLLHKIEQQEQELQRLTTELQQRTIALEDLQDLLTHLPLAYLQVDADNYLMWCSPATAKVLRVPLPDLTQPRLLLEWMRSYDLDQLIERTRATGERQEQEWVVNSVRQDPANPVMRRPLYLRGQAFALAQGQVGVFLDDRYEMITFQQQQNRWVSDVAHELKTPLTSIRLVAETLLNRVDTNLRSWVERLLNEVINLSSVVQDLLDLSQLDRARASGGTTEDQFTEAGLNLEPTDLVELIYAAWETLVPLNRHKQAHLLYIGPDSLVIRGDGSKLYRMLLNLLDNAIKYSPPDRDIEVLITPIAPANPANFQEWEQAQVVPEGTPPTGIILDVIDQGTGFPTQSLPYVFDRFYRADEARQRQGTAPLGNFSHSSSCGLGLAIVKQIVVAHNGQVIAKNNPATGGAWIQILLPITPDQPSPSGFTPSIPSPSSPSPFDSSSSGPVSPAPPPEPPE